jgi:hypothetical protein
MTGAPQPEASAPPAPRRPEHDLLVETNVRTCPNPVFVIGSPRSGTSILPWSLAQHPDLWTSGESEFLLGLFAKADAVHKALSERPHTFITRNEVERKEFLGALGLGVNALFSSRSGRKRWIDQTPGYTTMAWLLTDMFPGAYFIHVLRDGRAVVNSMLHFGDRIAAEARVELQGWATDFEVAVKTWKHYVEFALDFCEHHPDRTLTVKNEDLVERTDEEFERVLRFLGAAPDPEPAEFFRTSRINSSFAPLVWGKWERAKASGEDVVPRGRTADAWRDWSDEQKATFAEIAGDLTKRLGYPDLD